MIGAPRSLSGQRGNVMEQISNWIRRQLADRQLVALMLVLVSIALIIYLAGDIMAPVFAAVIIAYLMTGLVARLDARGLPHSLVVGAVFAVFLAVLVVTVFGLIPLLVRQLTQLVQQVPQIMSDAQNLLLRLSEQYPKVISEQQIQDLTAGLAAEVVSRGQQLVSFSLNSVVALLTAGIYLILVPFLVFFMVRDQARILDWLAGFLPAERQLASTVWSEVNEQIGNYVRGKAWEILVVGVVTYVIFSLLGLQYALLLAAVTGLSVLIPYVGAALVTLPVALVGYFQWGYSYDLLWVMVAYGVIQALDGNVLAPLLFSEVVNLHPVAVIVAILFFGGLWGFWGVFFAIPLATVIHAVIRAWPRQAGAQDAGGEATPLTASGR
jgi:putative permease